MGFVSGALNTSTGGTGNFSITTTKSVTAGNTLLFLVNVLNSALAAPSSTWLSSVTDNAIGGSNTYAPSPGTTSFFASHTIGTKGAGAWIGYCQALATTQSLAVSANFSVGSATPTLAGLLLLEYSGLGPFDVVGALTSASTNASRSSGSVTVAAGDTAIGLNFDGTAAHTTAITSPTTTFDYTDATPASYAAGSAVQGSSGSLAATFTVSTNTDVTFTALLAFQAAGAAVQQCGSLPLLGVGCGIWAAKKLEENRIMTRRNLIIPRRHRAEWLV